MSITPHPRAAAVLTRPTVLHRSCVLFSARVGVLTTAVTMSPMLAEARCVAATLMPTTGSGATLSADAMEPISSATSADTPPWSRPDGCWCADATRKRATCREREISTKPSPSCAPALCEELNHSPDVRYSSLSHKHAAATALAAAPAP